ncbi:MAG: hypothetical protein ACOX0X_01890 [Candidatus Dojkabacteria bacterium]|jgi:hypothetical protein
MAEIKDIQLRRIENVEGIKPSAELTSEIPNDRISDNNSVENIPTIQKTSPTKEPSAQEKSTSSKNSLPNTSASVQDGDTWSNILEYKRENRGADIPR